MYPLILPISTVEGDIRLVGGTTPNEGRVEVIKNGEYHTMCSDYSQSSRDANVICRQLGYPFAEIYATGLYGPATTDYADFILSCGGYESSVLDCARNNFTIVDRCTFDYSIKCFTGEFGLIIIQ